MADSEKDAFKDGIVIDHDLVLNGQGHTIDARRLARIFQINKGSVTIANATLVNGKADNGGAISFDSDGILNVVGSNFKYNYGKLAGAIHSFNGNMIITDSNFESNVADDGGADGVILTESSITKPFTINNSVFKNNTAQAGGAIFSSADVDVYSSIFINNIGIRVGGAILAAGENVNTVNSTFQNNSGSSKGSDGGAIWAWKDITAQDRSIFTDNSVKHSDGAFYSYKGKVTCTKDITLRNNQPDDSNVAINWI